MRVPGRRKAAVVFLVLGIVLIAIAVFLNVSWILQNLQDIALLIVGVIFFAIIITGVVLNTIFLLREIRRNEQQDAFLNAVTHELKTPIASIKLYLETLKTREVAEAKRIEFYDVMLSDSNRLMTTIEQVLQAGRTKDKARLLNISEIEVSELLAECVKIIRSRYNLANEINLKETNEKLTVSGDWAELQTVFTNLIDNAVKYSNEKIEVSIVLNDLNEKTVEICIKDSGVGIASNELKSVFKRFYRIPNLSTQKAKGTGLGLYIARAVIKKHDGKIYAESEGAGKGTTFTVRLPKAEKQKLSGK